MGDSDIMSRLRVRLVLNEGGEGAPLGQIVDIGKEVERFLRYLAEDSGIAVGRRDWVARDFENASVRFDIEAPTALDDAGIASFNSKFDYVDRFDPATQQVNGFVQHRTLLQYAKAAEALASHERMSFGLYHPRAKKPYEYKSLTKLRSVDLQQQLNAKTVYRTTIQGTIHDIGIQEGYFNLRDRKSGRLLRCDYRTELYDQLYLAAAEKDRLVYVRGRVSQRVVDRFVESMEVDQVMAAPKMPSIYADLFGKMPDYTGEMSTEEFVESVWSEDD